MHSYLMKICKSYDQSREALTHHEPQTVESFFFGRSFVLANVVLKMKTRM